MNKTEKKELLKEFELFLDKKELAQDEYKVGDVIDFTLTTGEKVSAMAMRQEEDGMLFVFIDCLKKEYQMFKNPSKRGSIQLTYVNSDLRHALNNEILDTFPEEIKSRMNVMRIGDTDAFDKLRLLTEKEVFGKNRYGEVDNGTRLPLMGEIRNRIAFQGRGTDAWDWWWLQNKAEGSAADFACVYDTGDAVYYSESSSRGVRPVFKI